jgi:hypothetical protein
MAAGNTFTRLYVADLNKDGRPDVIALARNPYPAQDGQIYVFLANGNNSFLPPTVYVLNTAAVAITIGDVNGDNKLDIVSANAAVNPIDPSLSAQPFTYSVYLGNGDGSLQLPSNFGDNGVPINIVSGDLNGDGKLDLAVSAAAGSLALIYLGAGDGTFTKANSYPSASASSLGVDVAIADVDKDGKPDIVFISNGIPVPISTDRIFPCGAIFIGCRGWYF